MDKAEQPCLSQQAGAVRAHWISSGVAAESCQGTGAPSTRHFSKANSGAHIWLGMIHTSIRRKWQQTMALIYIFLTYK